MKHLVGPASLAVSGLLWGVPGTLLATTVIGFDAFPLPPDSVYNGSDFGGDFTVGGVTFGNFYDDTFGPFWTGFSVSTVSDPVTPGFANQYASASGSGAGGSSTYAVAFDDAFGPEKDIMTFSRPTRVQGLYLNNTTYAARSMLDGDAFSKQFGGADGDDPDFFRVRITGRNPGGDPLGDIDVYLADYRFSDPLQDYVLTDWRWVDTSGLGPNVASLHFALSSSDNGPFGMNTPAYFAVDAITLVPEPGTFTLLVLGAVGLFRRRAGSS